MKLLTSILFAAINDDVYVFAKSCEVQTCGCNTEESMKWENEIREWKNDQKRKAIWF